MNERIWELWHQATLDPTNEDSNDLVRRFAELIVRECINVVGESRESRQTAMYYRHRIAEHFGVK